MVRKKIEHVSTEKLLKRKKFFSVCVGIYIGIFMVYLTIMIYDFVKNGNLERSDLTSGVLIIATVWIPLVASREINVELKSREDK